MKHIKLYESFREDFIKIINDNEKRESDFADHYMKLLKDALLVMYDNGYKIELSKPTKLYPYFQVRIWVDPFIISELDNIMKDLKDVIRNAEIHLESKSSGYQFLFDGNHQARLNYVNTPDILDVLDEKSFRSRYSKFNVEDAFNKLTIYFTID